MMTEREFCEALTVAVEDSADLVQEVLGGEEGPRVRSFEDAGVMTSNAGIVVRLADGSEFFVTVVRR